MSQKMVEPYVESKEKHTVREVIFKLHQVSAQDT